MKKTLLLLVVLLCYASAWASTPTPITSRIISEELNQVAGNGCFHNSSIAISLDLEKNN